MTREPKAATEPKAFWFMGGEFRRPRTRAAVARALHREAERVRHVPYPFFIEMTVGPIKFARWQRKKPRKKKKLLNVPLGIEAWLAEKPQKTEESP